MADTNTGEGARAAVVRLTTRDCVNYQAGTCAPPPSGPGAVEAEATYTIPCDVVSPRPEVVVRTGYVTGEGGAETVLWTERVRSVYRDLGRQARDRRTGAWYTLFTFYVLISLDVRDAAGRVIDCFAWAADPSLSGGTPPYDEANGREAFAFAAPAYTEVAL